MDLGIQNKTALVTGASRGIGRSIALALAREGAHVIIISRNKNELDLVLNELDGSKNDHLALEWDLFRENAPTEMVAQLPENFSNPDIVVHNIGGHFGVRDALCTLEDWQKVWRLNFEIGLELNRFLVPGMQKKKWGRIVHVSSISAVNCHGSIPYATTKAALNMYVRGLGQQVAADGITVSAVMPSAILTEGGYWDQVIKNDPDYASRFLQEKTVLKRFGRPDEVAAFVAFLCSDHASFSSGSLIPLHGGFY